MNKQELVIQILQEAQGLVKQLLTEPDEQHHALRIESTLQREINMFSLLTNTKVPNAPVSAPIELGNATSVLGQRITKTAETAPADLLPTGQAVQQLTEKVEDAYTRYASMTAEEILAKEEDIVLRGVAKKAGIKGVSKDNPKKIDLDFVQRLKEKIPTPQATQPVIPPAVNDGVQQTVGNDGANVNANANPNPQQ